MTSPENAPWLHAASSPAGTTSVWPAKVMCGAAADAGIEIVDVGGAGLAEGDAMHLEAGGLQEAFENAERAGIGGGDGRAADEVAGDGNGIIHAPLNTPKRRRASLVRHHFDLALLVPGRPRIDGARRQRVGAEPVGPARAPQEIQFDETPQTQDERSDGQRQIGERNRRQPVRELVVEAGHDEERHHPPAALVAVMQPLDRGRRGRPTGTATLPTSLIESQGEAGPRQRTIRAGSTSLKRSSIAEAERDRTRRSRMWMAAIVSPTSDHHPAKDDQSARARIWRG